MNKYDLGIIDAQYILRRNFSVQTMNEQTVDWRLLLKSFYQSIMKLKREFKFKRPILLFDKYPYLKSQGVEQYKTDRHYINEDDVANLVKEIMDCTDPIKKSELQDQLSSTQRGLYNEKQLIKAKYDVVKNGTSLGFPTLIKTGYEADDLSFGLTEKVREYGLSAILLTTDRDWVAFRSKEVWYSTPKFDKRNDLCKELIEYSKICNLPLYEIGVLKEIYGGSHNNVEGYEFSEKIPFTEFATRVVSKDETLPGLQKSFDFYNSMNMRRYLPELDKMLDFILGPLNITGNWHTYCMERDIRLNYMTYSDYLMGISEGFLDGKQ